MDAHTHTNEMLLIALDMKERRHARIEVMTSRENEQTFALQEGEATLSLFLELGSMVIISGSKGLASLRDRPVDVSQAVEICQSVRSRTQRQARTSNRRFAGMLECSFAYVNGRWAELSASENKPCVAIGLGGERLFAFRRDEDGAMREIAVATPSFVGQALTWAPVCRVPSGSEAFLDSSRFVVNQGVIRTIIRLKRIDGREEHRLLTINGGLALWSDPLHSNKRVLRAVKGGLILHETLLAGIKLTRLSLDELDLLLYAYYHAAMTP